MMHQSKSYQAFASPGKRNRSQINGESKQNIWSTLLDSVASGKRLPEKNLIVLGGNPEIQKEFLETLSSDTSSKQPPDRYRKKPPVANEFALGYTYQDVLDADHEDILARLSIYTLPAPSLTFAPLLKPLFTSHTVPDTLLLILLDWAEPWNWVRQIRDWLRLLRKVLVSLDNDTKEVMEENIQEWQQRRRGGGAYETGSNTNTEATITMPLGPGEWDEALGLPLCIVCHNSDKIDILEKQRGWREEEFDYVLQFLRTILLKHGASLIYTSNSLPNSLSTLIQSTLGIHSLLKRQPLKHNVIDRDKIVIPPNWDSWGKIRVLREGFDVEKISQGWSLDIQTPTSSHINENGNIDPTDKQEDNEIAPSTETNNKSPLQAYETTIPDPQKDRALTLQTSSTLPTNLEPVNNQAFLTQQVERIERLKAEEEQNARQRSASGTSTSTFSTNHSDDSNAPEEDHSSSSRRVDEHIGPVQFNMGGIQVDAEDMLKRLKDREQREETPDRDRERERPTTPTPTTEGKSQDEALANFFAGLMKRGSSSPRGSGGGGA